MVESSKFGPDVRALLFVQLASFPNHYLVIVVTTTEFRFALISVKVLADSPQGNMIMDDIGWLNLQRIHSSDFVYQHQLVQQGYDNDQAGMMNRGVASGLSAFHAMQGSDR